MLKELMKSACLVGLVFVMTCICAVSCDRVGFPKGNPAVDSTYIAEAVDAQINPSFETAAELYEYQQATIDEVSMNEAFLSMPQAILTNVATVCINKDGRVSAKSVVQEYALNKAVYDNLAPPTSASASDSTNTVNTSTANANTAMEEQRTLVVDSGIKKLKATQIDTVINGKHVQLIKYESNG